MSHSRPTFCDNKKVWLARYFILNLTVLFTVCYSSRSIRHSPSTHRTPLTLTQHLSTLGSDVRLLTNACQTSKTAFSNFKQRLALFPAFCVVLHVFALSVGSRVERSNNTTKPQRRTKQRQDWLVSYVSPVIRSYKPSLLFVVPTLLALI